MEQKVKQLVGELNEVLEGHANSDVIDAASVILIHIALEHNDPMDFMKTIAAHLLENTFINVTGIAKIINIHAS